MLRLLIKDITVEKPANQKQLLVHIRWQGGACSDVSAGSPRNPDQPSKVEKNQRHTYTTRERLAGMKPEIMRDQLGHFSVLMTLDVYSHANQAKERVGEVAMIEQYAMGSKLVM